MLNACEGARSDASDPFAGVAQSLIQQGLPAVVAMQYEITDDAAIIFAHEFYGAIADGYPLEAALAEARGAIRDAGNLTEWGTPVLYSRAPDGRLFDRTTQVRAAADRRAREASAAVGDSDSLSELRRNAADEGPAAFTLWERLRDTDFPEAERWLRQAVDLGDVRAAYRLGLLLWERRDLDGAEEMLRRGALDPQGAAALGRLLWRERGRPQDAVQWLDCGARAEDTAAQRDLGLVLRHLDDQDGARYWLHRAAERDGDARAALAEMDAERQAPRGRRTPTPGSNDRDGGHAGTE